MKSYISIIVFLWLICVQSSASLPPPAGHVECERSRAGSRCPQRRRLGPAAAAPRLQPGDLYPLWCVSEFVRNSVVDLPERFPPDKRLFETKRKDQLNALKNLVELNDINQQYKIIDIMLKGLFKVCVLLLFQNKFTGRDLSALKNKRSASSNPLHPLLRLLLFERVHQTELWFTLPVDSYLCIYIPHKDTQHKQASPAGEHCQHFCSTLCASMKGFTVATPTVISVRAPKECYKTWRQELLRSSCSLKGL